MTNARTTQQIIDDGARPSAAEQQAQLEAWGEAHGIDWVRPETVFAAITADEVDAYAADGFMSAHSVGSTHPSILDDPARIGAALPQREPGTAGERLRAIAAIHALADWFTAHPDVPAPCYVGAHIDVHSTGDFLTDLARLADLAHCLGVDRIYAEGRQFDVQLSGPGPRVFVIASVSKPDRPL